MSKLSNEILHFNSKKNKEREKRDSKVYWHMAHI